MPVSAKFRAAQKAVAAARKTRRTYPKTTIARSMPAAINRQVALAISRQSEKKYIDTAMASAITGIVDSFANSNDINAVNLIQQGAGFYNRIGRKVKMDSLKLNINLGSFNIPVVAGSNTGSVGNMVRMTVFWDRESGGVTPNWSNVFAQTSQQGTVTTNFRSGLRMTETERYLIIRDQIIDMNPHAGVSNYDVDVSAVGANDVTTATTATFTRKSISMFIDLRKLNLVTVFQSTSNPATVADIGDGVLYVAFRAVITNASNYVLLETGSNARLRYVDI